MHIDVIDKGLRRVYMQASVEPGYIDIFTANGTGGTDHYGTVNDRATAVEMAREAADYVKAQVILDFTDSINDPKLKRESVQVLPGLRITAV